jgi:hypothetical protein
MYYLDKQEYEERYGETVGFCNIHKVAVADNNCERCYIEHECELLSTCCGAGSNEYIDEFCNACNEYAEFECNTCEEKR